MKFDILVTRASFTVPLAVKRTETSDATGLPVKTRIQSKKRSAIKINDIAQGEIQ